MDVLTGNHLHVVSFNVPHPPDYGGVMDVYYRLKAFSELGVQIHLHCFVYNRPPSDALNKLCASVHYYDRGGVMTALGGLPYIVQSRSSRALLSNLQRDRYPVLFEGLHSCFHLGDKRLFNRIRAVRMFNVESAYYRQLARMDRNPLKKLFFRYESFRIRHYENALPPAHALFAISEHDARYFGQIHKRVEYIPPFHPYPAVQSEAGAGDYALYHADLGVPENERMACWLAEEVFRNLPFRLVITGRKPSRRLAGTLSRYKNIALRPDPSATEMDEMLRDAHVHLLPALQSSGFKLKLLTALFRGRFCIANETAVRNTGISGLFHLAGDAASVQSAVERLFAQPFTETDIAARKDVLERNFSNIANAKKMLRYLTPNAQLPTPNS